MSYRIPSYFVVKERK